jgi:hypothetical protein
MVHRPALASMSQDPRVLMKREEMNAPTAFTIARVDRESSCLTHLHECVAMVAGGFVLVSPRLCHPVPRLSVPRLLNMGPR